MPQPERAFGRVGNVLTSRQLSSEGIRPTAPCGSHVHRSASSISRRSFASMTRAAIGGTAGRSDRIRWEQGFALPVTAEAGSPCCSSTVASKRRSSRVGDVIVPGFAALHAEILPEVPPWSVDREGVEARVTTPSGGHPIGTGEDSFVPALDRVVGSRTRTPGARLQGFPCCRRCSPTLRGTTASTDVGDTTTDI
jgi:hypothetical protein